MGKLKMTGQGSYWSTLRNIQTDWLWGQEFNTFQYTIPIEIIDKNNGKQSKVDSKTVAYKLPKHLQIHKKLTEQACLISIFETIDGFLRTSNIGQFPMRLHLLRLFGLQLIQELIDYTDTTELNNNIFDNSYIDSISHLHLSDSSNSITNTNTNTNNVLITQPQSHKNQALAKQKKASTKRSKQIYEYKKRMASLVFGTWLFYSQYLPIVRDFQEKLKVPLQQKMKDQAKIGKH